MTTEKPNLAALKIDRSAAPASSSRIGAVLLTLLVVALVGAGAYAWTHRSSAIVVQVATVREEQSSAQAAQQTLLNATGYVTARREATVSSKVTGKVVELHVEEGMKVTEGQVLARLDASNVEVSLRLAEAQLESSRRSLEEIKPNVEFAESEVKRFANLKDSKAASESDVRRAEAEAKTQRAKLIRQNADVVVAEQTVAQWKQQLDDTIIRAPFAGVVTTKNAQPGEMISPMSVGGFTRTGICTIVDMNSLEIEVDVSESYINRVQPGQPVDAVLDAYSDWHIPCKVIAIIPTADRQKATVKVRIGFDKLDPRLLPEMGVKVAFQSPAASEPSEEKPTRGLAVPARAVKEVDGRSIVWVVRDGTVERRAVSITKSSGDFAFIASGLSSGEKVVVNAPAELTEGSHVTEKSS